MQNNEQTPTHPRQTEMDTLAAQAYSLLPFRSIAWTPDFFMAMAVRDACLGKVKEPDFTTQYGLSEFYAGISFEKAARIDGIIGIIQVHARVQVSA